MFLSLFWRYTVLNILHRVSLTHIHIHRNKLISKKNIFFFDWGDLKIYRWTSGKNSTSKILTENNTSLPNGSRVMEKIMKKALWHPKYISSILIIKMRMPFTVWICMLHCELTVLLFRKNTSFGLLNSECISLSLRKIPRSPFRSWWMLNKSSVFPSRILGFLSTSFLVSWLWKKNVLCIVL